MPKTDAKTDRVFLQNAIKTLATNIRFASVDNPIQSIVMTSSIPNEGKSTIAIELAKAMATGGREVLLVECDMRRRTLAAAMGLHARHGIYAVLSGQVDLDDAVVETSTRGMYFLDSEPHIPNPVDILASKRFHRFVEGLRQQYDFVIFDTPPLSAFVDAAVIGAVVDGVVLVVRENFVKRDELSAAYAQLQKAEANVIGAVLNFCESEKSEYYYSYYTKDGKKAPAADFGAPEPVKEPASTPRPAPAPSVAPKPAPAARPAQPARPAATSAPAASSAPGLKPIPQGGTYVPPDSTAQFLAGTPYASRTYTDE